MTQVLEARVIVHNKYIFVNMISTLRLSVEATFIWYTATLKDLKEILLIVKINY